MDVDIDTDVVNIIAWTIGSIDLSIGLAALARFYRFVQYENQQVKLAGTHRITRNYSLKKTFHISIMLAMFVRGSFVLTTPWIYAERDLTTALIAATYGGIGSWLILFSYFVLLFFWMDKYYVNSRDSERVERRLPKYGALFFVFFSLVVAIVALIIKFFLATGHPWDVVLDASVSISTCVFTLIIVSFFIFYGVRLYKLLKKYSFLKRRETLKGKKILFIVIGSTICFSLRAFVEIFGAGYMLMYMATKRTWEYMPLYVVVTYLLLLEASPVALMLFTLRRTTKRRSEFVESKTGLLSPRSTRQ